MKNKLFLVIFVLIVPALAGAEERERLIPKAEAFGGFTYSHIESGNSINLGNGFGQQAGIRIYNGDQGRLGVGFRIGRFEHEVNYGKPKPIEGIDAISVDGSAVTALGEVYIRSRSPKVAPYLFLGLGMLSTDHVYHSQPGGNKELKKSTLETDLGFGVRVAATKRLSINPEVHLMLGYTVLQAGIGISYRIGR